MRRGLRARAALRRWDRADAAGELRRRQSPLQRRLRLGLRQREPEVTERPAPDHSSARRASAGAAPVQRRNARRKAFVSE